MSRFATGCIRSARSSSHGDDAKIQIVWPRQDSLACRGQLCRVSETTKQKKKAEEAMVRQSQGMDRFGLDSFRAVEDRQRWKRIGAMPSVVPNAFKVILTKPPHP